MEIGLLWFLLAVVIGFAAARRGRSGVGWFVIAALLSPLIGGLLLLAVGRAGAAAPSLETHRKCPDCAELVLKEARVCKHCGFRLAAETAAAVPASAEPVRPPNVRRGQFYWLVLLGLLLWGLYAWLGPA